MASAVVAVSEVSLLLRSSKAGPTDRLPYEENVYIQCGGVLVKPGDVVCGDDDGVVAVP